MVAPIVALVAVVGVAVAGRASGEPEPAVPVASAVAAADVSALRTPLAELDPDARPTVVPFAPYPVLVARPRREHGTDGLMGRLPFDLPPDPVSERVDRFTLDDVVVAVEPFRSTPSWVRRINGLKADQVDPDQG